MNNVLIVTNFNAGRKKALKYKKCVIEFVLKHTKNFKFVDIGEFRTTDISCFDTIFVMGGDGTVNKILSSVVGTDKVVGIIPCGTANLLAAKLGLSSNIDKTLKIIDKNIIRNIDVMDINNNLSALRCGFGYDADIICKTTQSLKNKFGYFAYFIAGIIFALRLKKKSYNLKIDENDFKTDASCIIIANSANMYKNFVSVSDNSKLDDGLLDIFILKTTNPLAFFIEFILIVLNIRKNSCRAEYSQASNVCIKNNWQYCHIDGEKRNFKDDINISINKLLLKVFAA